MRLVKLGRKTYNLDQLVAIERFHDRVTIEGYVEQYDPFGDLIEPSENQLRDLHTIRLHFSDGDSPRLTEEQSTRFLAHVQQHFQAAFDLDQDAAE
jgi:hypothetical protein